MAIWHCRKATIRITLLAASFLTAILLGIASREPPPLVSYTTPGGRSLDCNLLYANMRTAFDAELKQNPHSPQDAANLAYNHMTRLYNGHDAENLGIPGQYPSSPPIIVSVNELNDAYRQCARGRE